jgi:GNAT superfamily N-acetyltransferase
LAQYSIELLHRSLAWEKVLMISIKRFSGPELAAHLDAVAALRIRVFREFPYLYDGNLEYEKSYLQTYLNSPRAAVVLALDAERVVGASTAIPLQDEEASFKAPFLQAGIDPADIFYCAESVLLDDYRGQGLGVRFFEEREAHALSFGDFAWMAFCAVRRPTDHPLRPVDYRPLDGFWQKRGFVKHPELCAHYTWKDIDRDEPTSKPLEFWLKSLQNKP